MAEKREKSQDARTIEKAKASKKDDFMLSDEELDKVAGGIAGATNVTTVRATIGTFGGSVMEPSLDPNGGSKLPDSFKSGGF